MSNSIKLDDFIDHIKYEGKCIGTLELVSFGKPITVYIFKQTLNFWYGTTDEDGEGVWKGYPKFKHNLEEYE
jgi:hypothetical protein